MLSEPSLPVVARVVAGDILSTTMTLGATISPLQVIATFAGVFVACFGINFAIIWFGLGRQGLNRADAWTPPLLGTIVLSAFMTCFLCPGNPGFWFAMEFAWFGIGTFFGLVMALNAGSDAGSGIVTNLARIADWLTKLLIGATLVNFRDILNWGWSSALNSGLLAFPNDPGAPVLITAVAAQFLILGAILGLFIVRAYLLTYFQNNALVAAITTPADGSTVGGTISASVTATPAAGLSIKNVQFQLDGANNGVAVTSLPYSINIDTTTLSDGTHSVTACVNDTAGNSVKTAPVAILVSNGSVAITAPIPGAVVSGNFSIAANATPAIGQTLRHVRFQVDGANIGQDLAAPPYTTSLSSAGLNAGKHTVAATATDSAGVVLTSAPVEITV